MNVSSEYNTPFHLTTDTSLGIHAPFNGALHLSKGILFASKNKIILVVWTKTCIIIYEPIY